MREKELKIVSTLDTALFQGSYVKELIEETDYPMFDIDGTNKYWEEWENNKLEDIFGFRNKTFKSLMTGTMAYKSDILWKDYLDDSMEMFLKR